MALGQFAWQPDGISGQLLWRFLTLDRRKHGFWFNRLWVPSRRMLGRKKYGLLCVPTRLLVVIVLVFASCCHCVDPLYNDSDDVITLKDDNYDRIVLATSNAWLIEFYNSWCGHCIRFAPTYKQLATDIKAWRPFIKVAGVDCAQEYNTELCQSFEITLYPTLKFFPAFASKRMNGTICPGLQAVDLLREEIVEFISNASQSNIGSRRLRLLQPLQNISDVWLAMEGISEKALLIFEEQRSYIGRQVILDSYGQKKRLFVRRILAEDVAKYGVTEVPSMFLVDKLDGSFTKLAVGKNRTAYLEALKLLTDGAVSSESKETVMPSGNDAGSPAVAEDRWVTRWNLAGSHRTGPDDSRKSALPANDAKQEDKRPHDALPGEDFNPLANNYLRVHEQDLESSLHYSLRHEVALFKNIADEALVALKDYIRVLSKYLPVQKPVSLFLNKVNDWLQSKRGPIKGAHWLESINRLQSPGEVLPESTTWTGCRGSETRFRGYPCSLWTTFHTLTVSAYDHAVQKTGDADESSVKEVLLAIRGYIKFFFGCRECSQNFMKGAVHIETKVNDLKSGVLFLWRSHNRANHFLSGDITEDPKHPKLQFPTSEQCPSCHTSPGDTKDGFDENEVLAFLQNVYTKGNLIPDSARLKIDDEKNDDINEDLEDFYRQKHKKEDWAVLKDMSLSKNSALQADVNVRTPLHVVSYSGFGKLDISMCVLFYFLCILIIVLVYLRFVRHRSLRMLSNSCKLPV